jgi:23S rRNA (guanosine2251-2'-O)-methyltransferase
MELAEAARNEQGTVILEADRDFLDRLTGMQVHQGVAAYVSPVSYVTVEEILDRAAQLDQAPFLLILDGIEDPHNLGAILRTAECMGVHGVVIPKRRAAAISSTVAKVSAGAVEHISVARVANLSQTISLLKEKNIWVAGTASGAGEPLYKAKLDMPLAIVIGGEGTGVAKLVAENCDFLIHIPITGKITSLNASAAAAICIYETVRQRSAGKG